MEARGRKTMKSILIIDDDESVSSFISFSLQQEGFTVYTAKNAKEGLTRLKKSPIDLLLMDVMLPDLDGFSLCEKVRSESNIKQMPVLFITAYADKPGVNLQRTQEVGGQGFIEKPVMFDELFRQILDAFDGRFTLPTRLKFAA